MVFSAGGMSWFCGWLDSQTHSNMVVCNRGHGTRKQMLLATSTSHEYPILKLGAVLTHAKNPKILLFC